MTVRIPDCEEVIRELWDWLDGEMDPARWDSIKVHLDACAGCTSHKRFAESFLEHVETASVGATDLTALRERVRTVFRKE